MLTEDIAYQDGAVKLSGFLAYDETVTEKRPGIIVVHEAWGLGEHAKERARKLAALGYVAFAIDVFGERRQVSSLPEAMEIIGALTAEPEILRNRARAGVAVLAGLPQVDATRLGGIGFCFGGTTVLELARGGDALAGVVSFHGGLQTKGPAAKGAVKASVLVCTGADDPMIPPEQVVAFEAEMRAADADWQVIAYGNTVHSFTNPDADKAGIPGIAYQAATDRRSWAAMQSFFAEVFAR